MEELLAVVQPIERINPTIVHRELELVEFWGSLGARGVVLGQKNRVATSAASLLARSPPSLAAVCVVGIQQCGGGSGGACTTVDTRSRCAPLTSSPMVPYKRWRCNDRGDREAEAEVSQI